VKSNRSPAVVKKWRRFLVVSCSHGDLADPVALAAVLRFKKSWGPDTTLHLGDAFDTRAFRTGAKGGSDEAASIFPDLDAGFAFLESLRPAWFICGNHEDRLWSLREHYNAQISALSTVLVERIESRCAEIGAKVIPYGFKANMRLGNFTILHGTVFGENASRDHAEMWGNCIHGHTHRAGIGYGRRADNPVGICTGHLLDVSRASYAKSRRSTMSWSQGFVWGEYSDTRTVCWLHSQPQGETEWRLPV
jgi:predicted phosphodiesterase